MIWVLIALMTGVAVLAVLWPLARRARDPRQAGDVAVYKDQLEEIERDQGFGLIAAAEAEAARIEVSRRLLAADGAARDRKIVADGSPTRRRAVAVIALVLVPAGALAVYLVLGSPDLPGQPLAARIAQAHGGNQSIEQMFARVEEHLAQHPDDGKGWEVVAPVYMRLGRYDDAVKARQNAMQLLGPTAERWSDLGEALVAQENGVVTGSAKQAFDNALKIDAKDVTARFYSGLAAEQDGRKADAARIWKALAADAPPGAEWLAPVQRALARVDSTTAPSIGASPQQSEMIRGMVERLAARLRRDGSDVDGWLRLVRSYTVLNEPDKARAAQADARRALADNAEKLARLEAGLKDIGGAGEGAAVPPPQELTIEQMVARLAARMQRDGSNVQGWIQLVRSYRVLERPDKARAAEDDARRALAGDADKLAAFEAGIKQVAAAPPPTGEQVATAPGAISVPPAAAPAQEQMIRGMVERLAARLHQDGSNVDGWIRLVRSYTVLNDADKARAAEADARRALAGDAEKLARLDAGLKEIAARPGAAASIAPPASSAAPTEPAQSQEQMIRGMVERLATRLHEDGSDVNGWLRLMRSYIVLGEADKARAAAADARNALKGDADKLRQLDEGAKSLGVGG